MSELPNKKEDIDVNSTPEWDGLAEDTPVVAADRLEKTSQNQFGQTVEGIVNDITQSQEAVDPAGEQPLLHETNDGGTAFEQQSVSNEAVYQDQGSVPDEGAPRGSRENPVVVDYPGGTMNTANKAASTRIGGPEQG